MTALTEARSASAFAARGLACGEQPDEPTHCWRCEYAFALDDLVDVDGIAHCGPCGRVEVGDELADRRADL